MDHEILEGVLASCEARGLLSVNGESLTLALNPVSLLEWLQTLFCEKLATKDLLYIAAASVRLRNELFPTVSTEQSFHDCAAAMRKCLGAQPEGAVAVRQLLTVPWEAAAHTPEPQRQKEVAAGLLEAALLFGALRPVEGKPGLLEPCGSGIDAAFLFHSLFGLHTSIGGFDELFEGGLRLADRFSGGRVADIPSGRVIIARGRFGTGKSTLALLIGAEVAKKGGFVWYYAIEESVRQRKNTLEALKGNEGCALFQILDIPETVNRKLCERQQARAGNPQWRTGQGIFSFYIANAVTYDSLMKPLDSACREIVDYGEPLTLMVVDPLNAVLRITDDDPLRTSRARLRANTVEILTAARRKGINVLLVCEEETETETDIQFMENIADTVIHLTVETHKDRRQRFLEISKSRYQKESGGQHAFNIESGPQLQIFPSSASLVMRYNKLGGSVRRPSEARFGLSGLDQVLGDDATFREGDIFAVLGPRESLRRILAFHFLLSGLETVVVPDKPAGRNRVLLVTTRDDERSIRHILEHLAHQRTTANLSEGVRVCLLPRGHIQPGLVIQRLHAEFEDAAREGQPIRRVVFDDVAYLELTCPFVREDEMFGTALLGFLSQHNATALFVCNETAEEWQGPLQTVVVNGAQFVIQLSVGSRDGCAHTRLRVTRSPSMKHTQRTYELVADPTGLRVETGTESAV